MALVKTVPYTIIVKTADLPTAGIAATVFIKVHGDKLSVKPIELGPNVKKRTAISQSPFSRNCTSHFSVTREDVGQITYIDVWHDAPQRWGCEFIEVQKGNDSWLFTPEEPINNQVSTDVTAGVPKPTRLVGEHSMVSNGANRLHNAAKYGDDKSLEKILQNNEFKVDVEDRLGRTPAMYACLYGQVTCLDILIEYEANLMKKDKSGKQCLHHACVNHKNNIEIITHLLESAPEVVGGAADEPDEIRNSDPGLARIMRYVRDRDGYGKNAMHYAASYGFVPVIQLLESKCRIAIRDKDHTGQTPLHCAAIQGETQAVLCLIELGCTVNAVDREQKTFLHQAATAGHADLISTVMKHVFPPNVKKTLDSLVQYEDTSKRTPLLCAAFNAKLDAVKVLVQCGADIYHVDEDKCNALHLAARTGDERILAFLSQQLDVNSTNNYGFTALHVAADANNRVAVQWLLKHQADVFAQTEAGESAKALAEGKGFKELVAALTTAESVQKQNKVLDKEKENAEAVAALAKAVPQVAAAVAAPPVDTMAQTPIMPPAVTPPRTAIQYDAAPNIDGARFTEIEEATSRVQELEHLVKDQRKQIAVLRDRLTVAAAITSNSAATGTPAGPGVKKQPPRACEEGCVIS